MHAAAREVSDFKTGRDVVCSTVGYVKYSDSGGAGAIPI